MQKALQTSPARFIIHKNLHVIQLDLWMFQKSINRINNVTLCTSHFFNFSILCHYFTTFQNPKTLFPFEIRNKPHFQWTHTVKYLIHQIPNHISIFNKLPHFTMWLMLVQHKIVIHNQKPWLTSLEPFTQAEIRQKNYQWNVFEDLHVHLRTFCFESALKSIGQPHIEAVRCSGSRQ